MNRPNYLSITFVMLLGFSSIHPTTRSNPLARFKARIASRMREELDKKLMKAVGTATLTTASLLILAQLIKPKEKEKSTPL